MTRVPPPRLPDPRARRPPVACPYTASHSPRRGGLLCVRQQRSPGESHASWSGLPAVCWWYGYYDAGNDLPSPVAGKDHQSITRTRGRALLLIQCAISLSLDEQLTVIPVFALPAFSEILTPEPCVHLLAYPDHAPTGGNPLPPTLIRKVSSYPPAVRQHLDHVAGAQGIAMEFVMPRFIVECSFLVCHFPCSCSLHKGRR